MKKLFFTLLLCFTITSVFSQSITPAISTEQCPGVNITFTVTIAAQSINAVQGGLGGPTVVQPQFNTTASGGNITFSFVGKFADWNQNQVFNVTYINSVGLLKTEPFTFTKIKSLRLSNTYSIIRPFPLNITAPLCQTQNFNIDFINVKYGNFSWGPPISYGTITDYEYQLPAGWKLGTTTSNGNTWISGGNNVTVTSDLSTGNNQHISIRPVNTACGTGLLAGQISKILISRPAPVFGINGPSQICTSASYNIPNLPSGATVSWSVTGTYSISGANTANPVTVQRTSNGYGVLTATIATSCGNYPVTIDLTSPAIVIAPGGNGNCGEATASVAIPSGNAFSWVVTGDLEINAIGQSVNNTDNTIDITGTSGTISVTTSACGTPFTITYDYQPYARNLTAGYMPIVGSEPLSVSIVDLDYSYDYINWYIDNVLVETGGGNLFYTNPPCGEHTVRAEASLPCGATVVVGTIDFDRYCGGWWRSMAIYPNPASSYLSIAPDLEKVKTLSAAEKLSRKEYEVSLYDINGKMVLKGKSTDLKLNLDTRSLKSDNYFLHIRIVGEKEIIKRQIIIKN